MNNVPPILCLIGLGFLIAWWFLGCASPTEPQMFTQTDCTALGGEWIPEWKACVAVGVR